MQLCALDTIHLAVINKLEPNWQMQLFACSQVCSKRHSWLHTIVYSWLHSIVHSQPAWVMLSRRSQRHCEYAPKYTQYILKYTPGHALNDPLNCTRWHTPSLLDCTLPSKLSKHSQVHLQIAVKYAPNCTWWYTPSLLGAILPSTLSRGKTLPLSLTYMLPCTLPHARSRDMLGCRPQAPRGMSNRCQAAGGVRQVEYGEQCVAAGMWCLACGWWWVAYGSRNHDVGRYHSLNIIFSTPTVTGSHHVSQSWCWQLQPYIPQER